MKKFMLLLHEDAAQMEHFSPQEMQDLVQAHINWAKKLAESGNMLGGDGLEPTGKLIIGQKCSIKDGPYLESKEMIGGYYLLQAPDLDAVIQIAMECPCHLYGGTTEIRAIMEY